MADRLALNPAPREGARIRSGGLERALATTFLHKTKAQQESACSDARRVFKETSFNKGRVEENHSHGVSASLRMGAHIFAQEFAFGLNLGVSSIQPSKRDENHKTAGPRDYRWDKDTDKQPKFKQDKNCVQVYIDVDMHMDDFPSRLVGATLPIIIYTDNPINAAGSTGDYEYHFSPEGTYEVRTNGGGKYSQRLWDYNSDSIRAVNRFFGIASHITTFHVEQRRISETKVLVLLVPINTWWGIPAAITECYLSGTELTTLNPVENGWATIYTQNREGVKVSVAEALQTPTLACTLALEDYEAARNSALLNKQDPTVSSMFAWTKGPNRDGNKKTAAVLASYFRTKLGMGKDRLFRPRKETYVTTVENSVTSYTPDIELHDNSAYKASIVAFTNPIITGGAYDPIQDSANQILAVTERITKFQSEPVHPLGPGRIMFINEFVVRLSDQVGILTPASFDEMWDKLNRPMQRAIIRDAENTGGDMDDFIKAFLKKEAGTAPKPARVISTIPGLQKLVYGMYTTALGKALKDIHWYGFGTPVEIAEKVAFLCENRSQLVETDYSKMDGHVGPTLRHRVEEPLMRRVFGNEEFYAGGLRALMRTQHSTSGYLGSTCYQTGYARASGSPETSVFNTCGAACIAYVRNRVLGLNEDDAWSSMGLYAGDDGLEAPRGSIPAFLKKAEQISANFGQVIKCNVVTFPDPPQFLSRYFGDAWSGGLNSMCDLKRQLIKFHTTVRMPPGVTDEDKLMAKCRSFLLTDANTPVIGDLCRWYIRTSPNPTTTVLPDLKWWDKYDEGVQFPNEYCPWMDEVKEKQLPDFNYDALIRVLESSGRVLVPTLDEVTAEPPAIDMVIDGELTLVEDLPTIEV